MSISLGLAENYAMLGSRYIYLQNAGDVKGFMGSNFLSYPPYVNADSNGIQLNAGPIPNAPIVNGAAAKQAIDDVNTAVDIMDDFKDGDSYNGIPINVFTFTGDQDLYDILDNNPPTDGNINVYKITENLTTSADVNFTVDASTVCIFIVGGKISIKDYDITHTGILPQNIIFIADDIVEIYIITGNLTVSGIYISRGGYAYIGKVTLTGRLISIGTTSSNNLSSITAPQFA